MPAAQPKSRSDRARPAGLVLAVVGAGAMGRIVIKDLLETAPPRTTVVVCDVDARRLRAAKALRRRSARVRLTTELLDVRDTHAATRLFTSSGVFGVINAAQHHFNLAVMDAAIDARAHYCDLGGLFHVTRKQIVRHLDWVKADRLALLGTGAAPGIVNLLARSAADTMEEVREIHVLVASAEQAVDATAPPLAVSYSIQTVIEEATQEAAFFTRGRLTFVPALSGEVAVDFPLPVGRKHPAHTIHSEVATLPSSYRSKGLRECSFRIAFPSVLVDRLKFLRSVGLLSERPLAVNGSTVSPREVLLATLRAPAPKPSPSLDRCDEYEILRVVVRGRRNGEFIEETVDCHTPGLPAWGIGSDINTGSPPSIVMQMLASGEITARGCQAPERAIPVEPFFRHLERRGMTVRRDVRPWRARS